MAQPSYGPPGRPNRAGYPLLLPHDSGEQVQLGDPDVPVNRAGVPKLHPANDANCTRENWESQGWRGVTRRPSRDRLAGEPPLLRPPANRSTAATPDVTGKQADAPGRGSDRGRPHPLHQKERLRAVRGYIGFVAWLPLGKILLGLQQPTNYQQLAHQLVEGLAGGAPVRIPQRPSEEHTGSLLFLRRHPPRFGHPYSPH
jgi:hypothetical protein